VGLRYWNYRSRATDIALSGRIEGHETDLAAKVGGRVVKVSVEEGDRVQPGVVVARLEDGQLQAQLAAAKAQVGAAQQQVNQAQLQVAVLASQIEEARLVLQQSQGDSSGRIDQAKAAVAAAQAQLAEAQAQVGEAESALTLAHADRDRIASLVDSRGGSPATI
jgi:HlyD family secretion protein